MKEVIKRRWHRRQLNNIYITKHPEDLYCNKFEDMIEGKRVVKGL